MKSFFNRIPRGITCLSIIILLFGYMANVMGTTNMLNTIMKTAHDLLLNTVFYLMGMCVITGALGKILVEFGVVDMLQKLLRPVMKPLFNMPGVSSLGAILTFLSDNPAIIALSQDRGFARYFKKYQHVSLVNFGTAFGMGLLVIVFMVGQGYFMEPFVGFFGAMCGCIIATRLMQYFTCKDFPEYRYEPAFPEEDQTYEDPTATSSTDEETSTFVRVLNTLLDGGKSGVEIGLAIIPGVLIISTLVMMLTFGGSTEGVDAQGNAIVVYTGEAYQGTALLPWLASKINFVFKWLFGFHAPELVSFPITALGAVGAALGLIPEFVSKGIIDGNAIAVCTAMGMCWSGYLSTDAATLDSLGYRPLVPRAFLSTFLGGICAGIITHWTYVFIIFIMSLFAPKTLWTSEVEVFNSIAPATYKAEMTALDDGTYTVTNWFDECHTDLQFAVNPEDSTLQILNAFTNQDSEYFFVRIDNEAQRGEPSYAVFYPVNGYSSCVISQEKGYVYSFVFIYDGKRKELTRGYYEFTWGGQERMTIEAEENVQHAREDMRHQAEHVADSLIRENLVDSILTSTAWE